MSETSLLTRLRGKLVVGIAVGALVYLAVILYSGWANLSEALAGFPWLLFPLLLLLAFANYLFRFMKWHFYLGRLAIALPVFDSLIIFLAGLVMTISPGKIGELLKAVLLKQRRGTPISYTFPIVIAERVTDFIALIIISVAGVMVFTVDASSIWVLVAVASVLATFIGVVSYRPLCVWLISLVERIGPLAGAGHKLHSAYDSISRLVRVVPLAVATFWSLLAWLCECLGFWIALTQFTTDPHLLTACFIYALGTIIGVASPGGLGLTEGAMIGMLRSETIMGAARLSTQAAASAATLIIRAATLWFAVAVGALVLVLFQKRFAGAADELEAELHHDSI